MFRVYFQKAIRQKHKYTKYLLSICVIAIGITLRLTHLTTYPPGFYVDEASIAENAYQIMVNGTDEWHTSYPVYFKAFGEYKNPLFIYSLVPLFKLLDPSILSTRLASAFWGLATVMAIGFLITTVTQSQKLGVFGLIITLFLPWHFYSSRVAFEAISMPFFFTIALIALVKYLPHPRFIYAWSAALATGAMFYSYTSARLLAPLLFITIIVIVFKRNSYRIFLLIFLYLLLLLPAIIWNQATGGSLLVRYEQIKGTGWSQNLATYFNQFSPNLWLGSGDTNLHHTANQGLLPLSYLPLFLLGLFSLLKTWRKTLSLLIMGIISTAPIPASLTQTSPNALRMIHLVPILMLVVTIGIKHLLTLKTKLKFPLLILISLAIIIEHAHFYFNFYQKFANQARWWFDAPYVELLPSLASYPNPIWLHHYLLNHSHQVTFAFLCHTRADCLPKSLNFSEKSDQFIPNATNIYFGDDCQKIIANHPTTVLVKNSEYCVYQ